MARTEGQATLQPFTFVGYELDSKDVRDRLVRSHLMDLRTRNKREAQAQSMQWKQSAKRVVLLPSMFGEDKHPNPLEDASRREAIGSEPTPQAALQKKKPVKRSKPPSSCSQAAVKGHLVIVAPKMSAIGSDKGSPTLPVVPGKVRRRARVPITIDFSPNFLDLGEPSAGEIVEIGGKDHQPESVEDIHVNESNLEQFVSVCLYLKHSGRKADRSRRWPFKIQSWPSHGACVARTWRFTSIFEQTVARCLASI